MILLHHFIIMQLEQVNKQTAAVICGFKKLGGCKGAIGICVGCPCLLSKNN